MAHTYISMSRKCELEKVAYTVASLLKNKYHIKRVFLIGSLAKGILHAKSDIDIVVEGLPNHLYLKALTETYELIPRGLSLNLIPFEDAFPSLKEKTLKDGILL